MLMLLAPVAVGLLGIVTKAAKQRKAGRNAWQAGMETKNNDTAVVNALVLEKEWEVISTSNNAEEMRKALDKGMYRYSVAEQFTKKGTLE